MTTIPMTGSARGGARRPVRARGWAKTKDIHSSPAKGRAETANLCSGDRAASASSDCSSLHSRQEYLAVQLNDPHSLCVWRPGRKLRVRPGKKAQLRGKQSHMCGIIFVVGDKIPLGVIGNDIDGPLLLSARDVMASRGPDGAGQLSLHHDRAGPVWMGHRRLAILDLSDAGLQPMRSDCGRYAIVYNGEVYNAPSLRHELIALGRKFSSTSDTEVIVTGFAEWGAAIVPRLIGMFAFAIWDTQRGCLFAARDRVGIKPLHYVASDKGIALASDARALQRLGLVDAINQDAFAAYLMLGYVPAPFSVWQGAHKLLAGTTLQWRPGHAPRIDRYWAPPDAVDDSPISNEKQIERFSTLLDDVVQDHTLSDVPVGVFLSGGIDSSLIASSLVRRHRDVAALTIGYPASVSDDEAPVAQRTAALLSLPWQVLPLAPDNAAQYFDQAFRSLDEPLAYSAIVSQAAVSGLAAQHVKVVLSGDGGDELFGGYRWHQDLNALRAPHGSTAPDGGGITEVIRRRLRPLLLAAFAPRTARRETDAANALAFLRRSPLHAYMRRIFPTLRPDEAADIIAGLSAHNAEAIAIEALKQWDAPQMPLKRRLQRIDLMTFCQDSVLPKVDRTAMAVGLEVRPPLLDHRLIEQQMSQPISPLLDGTPKGVAREVLRQRGLEFLLNEPKRGFSLKTASPYSVKEMAADATTAAKTGNLPVRADWQTRIEPQSDVYKLKVQSLYFFARWHDAIQTSCRDDEAIA